MGDRPGILDWYTVIGGVVALVALAIHGALYLAVKTEGDLQQRTRVLIQRAWIVLLAVTVVSLPATMIARPDSLANYRAYPIAFVIPIVVLLALFGVVHFCRRGDDRKAFACSCTYLAVMLVGAAVGLYPRLLPSSVDPAHDITIEKALSGPYALRIGLVWWVLGMVLAFTYFFIVYRMFRGKISLEDGGYGH